MSSGVSVDEFQALEQKVLKAVEIVKREREARAVAEAEVASLREQLAAQSAAIVSQVEAAHSRVAAVQSEKETAESQIEALNHERGLSRSIYLPRFTGSTDSRVERTPRYPLVDAMTIAERQRHLLDPDDNNIEVVNHNS